MASYLESNVQAGEWIGVSALKRVTDNLFPDDTDLPFWIWKILLRDTVFFQLVFPGWDIKGRQYHLDIRHVYTGQTRQEWLDSLVGEVYDVYDLLNPHLWVIEMGSLRREWHKLFVYAQHWRCVDATNHAKWLVFWPYDYARRNIDRLVSHDQRADWERQGYMQRINPCVYSVLEWWLVAMDRPNH
jgi:hypothetical protein